MSPKAIRDIINLLGVEDGVQFLNLLKAPEGWDIESRLIRQRVDVTDKDSNYSTVESVPLRGV